LALVLTKESGIERRIQRTENRDQGSENQLIPDF
jgi:hypothetical protein